MATPGTIQMTHGIAHPPARVWHALTDPALLARWWAPGDVRPIVGHHFTLDMGRWGMQACEVTAAEPERLLSYTFAPGAVDTAITWRLAPESGGTQLSLSIAASTSIRRSARRRSTAWAPAGRPCW